MTFRLTRLDGPAGVVLKIDGWLSAGGVPALEREVQCALADRSATLTLDLEELRQADDAAAVLLRRLVADGARLTNCPPYLALRLNAAARPEDHGAL
jgi:anti-anti-sigma regulatory factor